MIVIGPDTPDHLRKLDELERRLFIATDKGKIAWQLGDDDDFYWDSDVGTVHVSESGIVVHAASPDQNDFTYHPPSSRLYLFVRDRHEKLVEETLERLLADLDQLKETT